MKGAREQYLIHREKAIWKVADHSSGTMKIRRQIRFLKYGKKMSAQNSVFSENVLPKNSSVQAFTFDFVSSTCVSKKYIYGHF